MIFDLDGVLSDSAKIHAAAWKDVFDAVLPHLPNADTAPFDEARDYPGYVEGRPGMDGIREFLASRGAGVPEGTDTDDATELTVHGLAALQQRRFTEQLTGRGVHALPGVKSLLRRLHADNVHTAVVTSSRNGRHVLESTGLARLVSVLVDGTDAARLSLPGKPSPAMFLQAARQLQTHPAATMVVDASTSGVRAAAAGRFGLVVGVCTVDHAERLRAAGATVLVASLSGLDWATVEIPVPARRPTPPAPDPWSLLSHGFDPAHEGRWETMFTLGNGYWATRGSQPGSTQDGVHCPGTYFAGVYNRRVTTLGHTEVESEHLVNAPDWTYLAVYGPGGEAYSVGSSLLVDHTRRLDLRRGILSIDDTYVDAAGRAVSTAMRRLQSQADPHLAAMQTRLVAGNWSGTIAICSAINTAVANRNAAGDAMLAGGHLLPPTVSRPGTDAVLVEAQTSQSRLTVALASQTRVLDRHGHAVPHTSRFVSDGGLFGHEITLSLTAGEPVIIEKIVAAATSRDPALSTAGLDAAGRLARAPGFAELQGEHVRAWQGLWSRFAVELPADTGAALAMNLNTFHVLQSVPTGVELDAGIPARGLHGEGYRGHIFWDELFVYPMLTLRRPALTRSLLMYRYRRLGQARAAASAAGLKGAMFPWQSGSSGRDETPAQLFNTLDGRWMPDNSHLQVHVGLAVAYSVWQYYQATADDGFLAQYGAEMLVEVARFFAGLATYDPTGDRFDISGVMGPDEFHDAYPDGPGTGLRNNSYTNVLTSWVLSRADEAMAVLAGLDTPDGAALWAPAAQELRDWDHISRRLRVHFHADGIISQFDGYEALADFDWKAYRDRYGDLGRLDLILQAEGDSTNRYQISKQADVLMLFYLFSAEELRAIFERLGYALPAALVRRTVSYFLARTSHGSTLSRLAHSWVLARSDREKSWSLFNQALECDLADSHGGTTREGVHLGAMAGTVDMAIRCYGGVETRQDELLIHPRLPAELPRVVFQLSYRGQPIDVELTHSAAVLRLHPGTMAPIHVRVEGIRRTLHPGSVFRLALRN
ncbi:HAD-IA family hydrolase [Specibacter sp. RAF43]|uniref:HAD-IA family hydrolase n=1 Tax=Specibacter sp. RAF43 TaxID=3233057 RepID=UPI003F943612